MQSLQQLVTGQLKGVKKLKISNGLKEFPREIYDLADTLEYLDLSGNHLSSLPADFWKLKKLKIFFCSENDFIEFPAVLGQCTSLDIVGFKSNKISIIEEHSIPINIRWLILTNNCIQIVPSSIGNCTRIQKLMLAGNQINWLPDEMSCLKKLELLRISANSLEKLPEWLLELPRLSWLAFAGNIFNENVSQSHQLTDIPWGELSIDALLGEGASGHISKAIWNKPEQIEKVVAVKVFKGEVTSDGFPADEMNACIAAGIHDHIVPVLGCIKDHPQQKKGLVLELIPPQFKIMGGPPDFSTCTRDTFPDHTFFNWNSLLKIAKSMANACAHMHSLGIMHGDLYAHNILINEYSHALIGDFGAATIYNRKVDYLSNSLEKIEVRAYGCLLEDMLNHISTEKILSNNLSVISELKNKCMNEEIMLRPDFKEIGIVLDSILAIPGSTS